MNRSDQRPSGRSGRTAAIAVAAGIAVTAAALIAHRSDPGTPASPLMRYLGDSRAAYSTSLTVPDSTGLVVRARTQPKALPTDMTVAVDGSPVGAVVVSSATWSDYTFGEAIPAGTHQITVSHSDDGAAHPRLLVEMISPTTGPLGDEFDGDAGSPPDPGLWTAIKGTGWDPGVQNYLPENARLDGDGNLVLRALTPTAGEYTSARIESLNKLSVGYGTTTARIKAPGGQGLWPAFWLKGADEDILPWPESGEIDVMELPSTTTTLYSTLHGPIADTTTTRQAQIVTEMPDLSADYHDYWVRHLPDEITFGVDGTTVGSVTPESLPDGAAWVYNRPMHVLLNLAVGGPWPGPPDDSTQFPAAMIVDWVRWVPA